MEAPHKPNDALPLVDHVAARIQAASDLLDATYSSSADLVRDVRALLDAGAGVNHVTDDGWTPLMFVSKVGDVEFLRFLIGAGADLDRVSNGFWTALMIASFKGRVECARELLFAGADAKLRSKIGTTALRRANTLDMVQLLCAYGAQRDDLLVRGPVGRFCNPTAECWTWLSETVRWVSQLHHVEFHTSARVRELLRAGADVHSSDGAADAPTPLSIAQSLLVRAGFEHHEGAHLVVAAAKPWSRHNHELFPLAARVRAVELLWVGKLLAKQPGFVGCEIALLDAWTHVMAYAVLRD